MANERARFAPLLDSLPDSVLPNSHSPICISMTSLRNNNDVILPNVIPLFDSGWLILYLTNQNSRIFQSSKIFFKIFLESSKHKNLTPKKSKILFYLDSLLILVCPDLFWWRHFVLRDIFNDVISHIIVLESNFLSWFYFWSWVI